MYVLNINDIMFFINSPHDGFSINNLIKFATWPTHLASGNKFLWTRSSNNTNKNFYFNQLPCIWNALPVIDHQEAPSIKAD